jgi:NAD(P)-dependent dehydrogenase (short-subunit alcohol dehydrogenase family)
MPTALILGASRGIGREFVRQLLKRGWQVHATARDETALADLRNAGAQSFKLDVTRAESLAELDWRLDGVELDLAVYVAGVYGPGEGARSLPLEPAFDAVMHANLLGAMQALALVGPLVESARGRFAFITSGMGSIAGAPASDHWIYRVSKAGLNMAVKSAAQDYRKAILVALSPGWVVTDMGGPHAPLTAQQSVDSMLTVLDGLTTADSGSFLDYDGRRLPW